MIGQNRLGIPRAQIEAAAAAAALMFAATAATGQLRIVNYNCASLNGDGSAMIEVFEALNDDDKPGFAVARVARVASAFGKPNANTKSFNMAKHIHMFPNPAFTTGKQW